MPIRKMLHARTRDGKGTKEQGWARGPVERVGPIEKWKKAAVC